jgi:acyl dehydratase
LGRPRRLYATRPNDHNRRSGHGNGVTAWGFRGAAGEKEAPRRPQRAPLEQRKMVQTVTREELAARVGQQLGVSAWFLVDQERVNRFADVTLDHQFVHVDLERAKQTPFGGTIAHGFLTLSLLVPLCLDYIPVLANRTLLVNYGFDKIRFVAPVRVGKRVRALGTLAEVSERKPGNVIIKMDVTVEIENEEKPALVAEWLSLHVVG